MVVCARGLEFVATANQFRAKGPRVCDDLLGICLPCWLGRLEKSSGDTSDGVVVGTTLASGEHGLVDTLLKVSGFVGVLAVEDQTSARATKGLVPDQIKYLMKE